MKPAGSGEFNQRQYGDLMEFTVMGFNQQKSTWFQQQEARGDRVKKHWDLSNKNMVIFVGIYIWVFLFLSLY